MTTDQFHMVNEVKRRGGSLPGRLRISSRRGVTLVELLISMLILTIVCIAWLQIIGIQSARKEARRREAVERLAGMMDAFMYVNRSVVDYDGYEANIRTNSNLISFARDRSKKKVHPMFDDGSSPIGYQLIVVDKNDLPNGAMFTGWTSGGRGGGKWLVGRLFNSNGILEDVGAPFFALPVCLGL